ncbi:MAG TPA: glycerol dehydrogenase [Thermotogota bacterium]|nr:glycerol dehydrogenase [Thermotogota bacterium]HRW35363.1 glycerol dehydrogenase [Thermotogota bacterium]
MAKKIIISPGKYIQGPGEINNLAVYCEPYGTNLLVIASESVTKLTQEKVENAFKGTDKKIVFVQFNRECSRKEIERLKTIAEQSKTDVFLGIGGGKALDTAKAVAFYLKKPVIAIPTIASTDAPCSAISVVYTDEGVFEECLMLPSNPAVVLVDTDIIAQAPVRFLVSGMGDALATYFEARAVSRANSNNTAGGKPTQAALALAKLCYDKLLSDGLKAKLAAQSGVTNPALEIIIETNTYLSGMGFESGGLAAAHAIHNGLTALKDCRSFYHGEKVAFGTIVQLALENAPMEEITEVIGFCKRVGLPTTLKDLNAEHITHDQLRTVAQIATAENETIHNMPFPVDQEMVFSALITADQLGSVLI